MRADKYKEYMYHLIDRVLKDVGARESCSDEEKKLGSILAEEWKTTCDTVDIESFTCSPTCFLGFLPFLVILHMGAVVFYWILPPLSFVCAATGFAMLFFELVRYREFLDPLWPKRNGENVLGHIKPRGKVTQRVIVSAHMDSAYECNLWLHLKNAAIPVMIFAMAAVLLMLGASLARSVAFFSGGADSPVFVWLGMTCVVMSPFVGLYLRFHSYVPVPGAMDDLAGCAVVAGLGQYLNDAKQNGAFFPENTEIVLFGSAAEESGLRGAKRYVKAHKRDLQATPTYGIFLDGIYDEKHLTVVSREIGTGARHDPYLIKLAQACAAKRGWPIKTLPIPMGASDAAAFSREGGVPSTCLLCQDISKLVPNYHTRFDTIEHVRPESLIVSLQLVIDMVEKIDKT
jgi:aminopeptidase YwaD